MRAFSVPKVVRAGIRVGLGWGYSVHWFGLLGIAAFWAGLVCRGWLWLCWHIGRSLTGGGSFDDTVSLVVGGVDTPQSMYALGTCGPVPETC